MDTGIRADRMEVIREIVSRLLEQAPNDSLRASGYVHMFGVAQNCVLIAMKRGEDAELAAIAGYLHDISSYMEGYSADHARKSAKISRKIMAETELFASGEIDQVCTAILFHSEKKAVHGPLDEILKDADVMQHCLFNPDHISKKEEKRYEALCKEFLIC